MNSMGLFNGCFSQLCKIPTDMFYCALSHPILRIKWDAKSYVHQEISHTHNQQIINSIITSVYYITNNKTGSSHKYSGSIKKRSLAEAPYHRDVDWLTTSLVVLRKIIYTKAICYPSGIFIQIMKINSISTCRTQQV